MNAKTSKENICINQLIGKKEEILNIQGDEIVPDIKPDILSIISSTGTICIYKKEISNGKIRFDGSIYIYTLYIADNEEGSVKSINSSLDFSKTIEIDNVKPEMQLESTSQIVSINCKILNGRKISIESKIKIKIKVYSNEEVEFITKIEDVNNLQTLDKEYAINSLIGNGSTKVYAKDTIAIDNTDNLQEIIKAQISINKKENKISYNKVLTKADADVKIIYITEDGRINVVNAQIPVTGFIDMHDITEDNLCDTMYELKNFLVKPNSIEEHSIYVEAEIDISCYTYSNKKMNIIQDLYSPGMNVEYEQKNIKVMQNKRIIKDICNIRKQEEIKEIGKNKIYDVEVLPIITKEQIENGRIIYEGELNLKYLYQSGNNIATKEIIEAFNFNVLDEKIDKNSMIETQVEISTQDFIVMPDESIDIKIDLDFAISVSNMENFRVINEVQITPNTESKKSSIIIYYTKKGDSLWNIAKRFDSTVEAIAKINNIENPDFIMPGEQLFIV